MGEGFLGYSASLMMDVIVCVLAVFVPVLGYSIYTVKVRRDYAAHKRIQIVLATLLLASVALFEIDIRLHGGWRELVARRPNPLTEAQLEVAAKCLYVHLFFAISSTLLWIATFVAALRRFPTPVRPAGHSRLHRLLGWAAAIDVTLTTITGLLFYYHAFVVGA